MVTEREQELERVVYNLRQRIKDLKEYSAGVMLALHSDKYSQRFPDHFRTPTEGSQVSEDKESSYGLDENTLHTPESHG